MVDHAPDALTYSYFGSAPRAYAPRNSSFFCPSNAEALMADSGPRCPVAHNRNVKQQADTPPLEIMRKPVSRRRALQVGGGAFAGALGPLGLAGELAWVPERVAWAAPSPIAFSDGQLARP